METANVAYFLPVPQDIFDSSQGSTGHFWHEKSLKWKSWLFPTLHCKSKSDLEWSQDSGLYWVMNFWNCRPATKKVEPWWSCFDKNSFLLIQTWYLSSSWKVPQCHLCAPGNRLLCLFIGHEYIICFMLIVLQPLGLSDWPKGVRCYLNWSSGLFLGFFKLNFKTYIGNVFIACKISSFSAKM